MFVNSKCEYFELTEDDILTWKSKVNRTKIAFDWHEEYLEKQTASENNTDNDESEISEEEADVTVAYSSQNKEYEASDSDLESEDIKEEEVKAISLETKDLVNNAEAQEAGSLLTS